MYLHIIYFKIVLSYNIEEIEELEKELKEIINKKREILKKNNYNHNSSEIKELN
jgi:hypothetical protein